MLNRPSFFWAHPPAWPAPSKKTPQQLVKYTGSPHLVLKGQRTAVTHSEERSMRLMLQAVFSLAVPLAMLAGTSEASEIARVEFPSNQGNYVQAYESGGTKWIELVTIEANGHRRVAKGTVSPEQGADFSKRLYEVSANFGPCGTGKLMQPDYVGTTVYFEGFKNGTGECEIQNPPYELQRIIR
ncbi:hypothetical protein [Pseudomonas farris]